MRGFICAADPDRIALLAPGRVPLTYGRLRRLIAGVAAQLRAGGIQRRDRVAIVLPNGPELATTFLATASVATAAPLNPQYRDAEFAYYLDDLRPRALVVAAGGATPAGAAARARGIPVLELHSSADAPAGWFDFTDQPTADAELIDWAQPDDVALLLHTSGTTARPKGVPLTHTNLGHSAAAVRDTLRLTPDDRCLNVMPLFHVHGLVGGLLSSLAAGASSVCTPAFSAVDFFAWIEQTGPTWYTAVPTMHQAILARVAAGAGSPGRPFRLIRSSSAPLPPAVMADLERVFAAPVIEAYGMTEAAHQMASNPLPPGRRTPGSVGQPTGIELAIFDDDDAPLPAGQVGHVVIRGPSVTRGYDDAPEANAAAFVDGWFRTGDLGRLDGDGALFLAGRSKEIINRGGEKISPREIDEILLGHPAVAQAVTFGFAEPRLGEEIGAAVVLRPDQTASAAELEAFVAARVADFKVPRRFVFVAAIPTGPTGKLQRVGLAERLGVEGSAPPPAVVRGTATEQWLLALWRDLLAIPHVAASDDFFDLGGDSVLAMRLAARIEQTHGIAMPPTRVFQLKTVAAMAEHLDDLRLAPDQAVAPIPRAAGAAAPALSFQQERIWFISTLEQREPTLFVTPLLYRLTGPLDVAALNHGLSTIVERHDALRTCAVMSERGLAGRLLPATPLEAIVHDVSAVPAADRAAAAREAIALAVRRGFDLGAEPLIRCTVVRTGPSEHLLLLQTHHFATDGWSKDVLWRDLTALYEAFAGGRALALPAPPIRYCDYAAWQRATAGALREQTAFWVRVLAGATTTLQVPADHPRPARQTFHGAMVERRLPADLLHAVKAMGRREDCTLFMVLLAGWQSLLFRYTGETAFCVGVPVAGRTRVELEPLVGMFVNTLALPADLSGRPTFRELARRVRRMALEAYAHQEVPFEQVVEALQPDRNLATSPVFQVMFQLRNYTPAAPRLAGLDVADLAIDAGIAQVDLTLETMETADGLRCTLNYNTDLFTAASADRILGHYATLLEAAVADVDRPVAELPLLTAAERHVMLDVWGRGPRRSAGVAEPIHRRFEATAAAVPDEVAARDGTHALTYQQLNGLANRVAHYLRDRGATAGAMVGVCLPRSVEMVAMLLGVMKTGAIYLPVDPDYPQTWREDVLADAGADLVVSEEAWRDPALHAASSDNPGLAAAPSDIAYVIYTSGSTGRPKGVAVPHAALANVLGSLAAEPGFAAGESLLAVTPISFDIAAAELFLPLLVGGRVRIADRRTATDGVALARLIAEESPAVLQATPSTWRLLIESGWAGHRGLRAWCGGETLNRPLAQALLGRCDSVWNLYGPTETTIWSTVARVEEGEGPVPIGRPIAQTDVQVVDAAGQPVPANVPGELLIGGAGVAAGYLHRPELTAERFGASPGTGDAGRMYRTGDLVYYRPDGHLVHVRRLDNQVKLRGHRIELGEVETRLAEHPQVRAAAAAIHGDGVDARLVGYVEAGVPPPEPDALRVFLADRLPAHLVPATIVTLDRLPLTSNGKLDRAQLPAPLPPPVIESSQDVPLDQKAATLVRLWEEVLDRRPIGVNDDFFALGGYSLLAARLIARINHVFDWHLPVSVLFEAPTVAQLAEVLRRGATTSRFTSSLIPLQPDGQGPPLFLVARFSALGFRGLVRYLGRDRPIYALVPPGPDNGATPIATVEALAAHYVGEIRRVQPVGPYVIAGYSFGAFPAYEAARQLDQAGETATVVLIDGGVHLLPRHVSRLPARLLWRLRLRHLGAVAVAHARELRHRSPRRWLAYLTAQSRLGLRRRLVPFHADASTPRAVRDVERANKHAFATYRPGRFAGRAIAIRSSQRIDGFDDPRAGWAGLVGDFREVSIPDSTHTTLLDEPHVAAVVACLRATVVPTRTV